MKDIRIAVAVTRPELFQVERNLEAIDRLSREAALRGARVVCFPELSVTGYGNGPAMAGVAQTVPGEASRRLAEFAAAGDIVILAGMAEKGEDGRYFMSHLTVMPDGEVSVYRKLHLAPPERVLFSPGDGLLVQAIPGLTFGVQLCYDAHFPELSTLMAEKGADLIFIPHASPQGTPEEKFQSWMRHLPARAFDNSVFVAACNPTGENEKGLPYPGLALIIDPSGRVQSRELGNREALLFVDLRAEDLERVRGHRMRFFRPNRRPNLYRRLQGDIGSG